MKKKLKRLLCSVLAAGMILGGTPVSLYADMEGETTPTTQEKTYHEGNATYTYEIQSDNTLKINDYSGTDTEITIPGEIDGKKVTVIADGAFAKRNELISVRIPEGVRSIGVSSIEAYLLDGAFQKCENLVRVELPESLTRIGDFAFKWCRNLETIQIPSGVTFIGEYALSGCWKAKFELPESLVELGRDALGSCYALERVNIPASVKTIGESAFWNCRNLKTVEVAPGNTNFAAVDNVLFDKEMTRLIVYPAKKEGSVYAVPATVKDVGIGAFMYCESLTDITIPSGVTELKLSTFSTCTNLERLILPEGLTFMGNQLSERCSKLKKLTIPKSVSYIGFKAWGYYPVREDGVTKDKVYDDFVIYGYANTAAQTYADENGIPFVELDEKTSDTGVKIEFSKDAIASTDTVSLLAKQLSANDKEYQNIVLANKLVDTSVKPENVRFTAYDITLKNSAGTTVQPKGNVTVKIPMPTGYDGSKCKIYYVNDKGEFVDMKAVYDGESMIFETNHFSTYMITETQLKTTDAPAVIYADANSDGTVNSKDVVMMKKHLAGIKVDINLKACDVNADGKFDSKDVVKTMKKLAGYDVVLGEK